MPPAPTSMHMEENFDCPTIVPTQESQHFNIEKEENTATKSIKSNLQLCLKNKVDIGHLESILAKDIILKPNLGKPIVLRNFFRSFD